MPDRPILMIPGPTEIPWRVVAAMMKPSIPHYDPAFNIDVLDSTLLKLRKVFQTQNEVIAVPGSGRVSLETAITSIVERGDKVLAVIAGVFGAWMKEMVDRAGGEGVGFEVEWGQPIDLNRLEDALQRGGFKALTVVHNETSSGACYPIEEIGKLARRYDVLYLVDTVSSLGGIDVRTDDWGIDINMTSSHKCLTAPLGIALTSISERAWEAMEERKTPATSFSYDLLRWRKMWLPPERGGEMIFGWRRQPVSMPVHLIYALDEATDIILEEGLENRFKRHATCAGAFREGMKALGLEILADESVASSTVTCVRMPEGISSRDVLAAMRNNHNIIIARGLEREADRFIRVGHMGMTASPQHIIPTIAALESTLSSLGVSNPLYPKNDLTINRFMSNFKPNTGAGVDNP